MLDIYVNKDLVDWYDKLLDEGIPINYYNSY